MHVDSGRLRMPLLNRHLYSFGPFRLDTRERMLLRDGQYVPLTPKALETLMVLVEHGGRIVEKEEFLRQVWPDTFVEDVTLAKNVSSLRKILGDGDQHQYIETIPKRGYRFVADVRIVDEPTAEPVAGRPPGFSMRAGWAVAASVILAAAGLAVWYSVPARRSPLSGKTIPLTSSAGHQNQVAFSPNGKQIAFVQDSPDGGTRICVKTIGSENVLQLTHGAASDSKPAWSPDGQSIAFLRASAGTRAWYVIPALGGAERKITDVFPYFDLGSGNSPYFAPDGKSLAIVDKSAPQEPAGIYLVSLANPERRKLTTPPPGTTGDYYPAFSPDGKQVAFARAFSFSATDLYVLPRSGQTPRRLTFDGLTIEGLTWTPDSREIVFSSRRGGSVNSLWRIAATGGGLERVSTAGEDVISPAISAGSKRLAYTRVLDDMNIWSLTLGPDGREIARAPLIASTFRDSDPDFSPDGAKIAFTSARAGSFGIWVSGSDGSNPRSLFDGGPYVTGSPRWSPDGRWIAFDTRSGSPANAGNPSVWIIGAEGRALRRLTAPANGAVAPSWSHDGQSVYFASTRSGNLEVWKIRAAGGTAVQITRGGGFEAFESADGRYLYYLKGRAIPGIWRVPVAGGEEMAVTERNQAGLWRSWRVAGRGIYYATAAGPPGPRLEFLDLGTGQIQEIDRAIKAPDVTIPSLAVSPDRRRLLYAQYDQSGSNILMVEGFR